MGGSICVAVRRSNGKEVVMETWTNSLPHYFNSRKFLEEDSKTVNKFIKDGCQKISYFRGKLKEIDESSYGVILIDFKDKLIWSHQGYCGPGTLHLTISRGNLGVYDIDDLNYIAELAKSGTIISAENWNDKDRVLSPEKLGTLVSELTYGKSNIQEDFDGFYILRHSMTPFTLIHNSRGYLKRQEVDEVLKKHGWKTKTSDNFKDSSEDEE